ncbi:GNAT family N-acetyltransferase [Bacillus sp. AK031]
MKTTAEQVKIVEYHEGLAKGVAKMWNESRENWGADATVTTEQDVKEKEANSVNLHLFLAMAGEEVVGYCGLSQYREDEGALYIPLLNVHPDYQGLKIGKQLVLKALEKTIELKWPRLDLFTWAGNTKAVPLYKKCGFFWEEKDDSTHLMNFIPLVMQIDLLKPFFRKHDWYTTSQREIKIEPDGIKSNEHTCFEYKWEAGDEFVRVQIERTGRGIRLIETQDFLIEMNLADFKLLEKQEHSVTYRVVNRTEQPLNVYLSGESSDIVSQDLVKTVMVEEEWSGHFPATVSLPEREPSPWKTHPVISANVKMDGFHIPLKMGVFPKQAGKISLRSTKKNWRAGQNGLVHLDIESQLEEDSTFTIYLPKSDVAEWERSEVKAEMNAKQRISFPIPVKLVKNGFLTEEAVVVVERPNQKALTFKTTLSLAFPGFGSKFGGETEEHWYCYNGAYYVQVEKRNHHVTVGSIHSSGEAMTFFAPKLGKPFSEEFSKKEASNVEFIPLVEKMVMKTTLESDAYSSLSVNTYLIMYGDGYIEMKHEIINTGNQVKEDIYLLQPVFSQFRGAAIPQKGGVVMVGTEAIVPFMDYISDKDISENWMFISGSNGEKTGLSWPEESVGRKDEWRFGVEYKVNSIQPHEEICLGPIGIGVNTAAKWQNWRDFVLGEDLPDLKEAPLYALESAGGDFVSSAGETVEYSFRSMLTPYVHGSLKLKNEGEIFERFTEKEDGSNRINLQVEHTSPGIKRITGSFSSSGQKADLEALQLVKGKHSVRVSEIDGNWTVDNGVISFSASSAYYPGVYSLKYDGKETLHHQYPEAGPRAWWNPWGGGIRYFFHNVSPYSMLKEETKVEKVSRIDQNGHEWTGLCLTTEIKEHESMKGVTLKQYALTLPEVPVLAFYGEVHQRSGRTFHQELVDLEAFFKPGKELSSSYVTIPSEGVFQRYYAGVEEFMLGDSPYVTVGSDEKDEKITLIHPASKKLSEVYMNQEVFVAASIQEWSASSGETFTIKPTILLIGEEEFTDSIFPLKGITFR